MSSILKSYKTCTETELTNTSNLYQLLAKKGDEAFKAECWNLTPETIKKLGDLFGIPLTAQSCMFLLRPIVRAKQLAGIIGGIDIAGRKKVSQQLIRFATSIKKDLSKAPLEADVIRLFMECVELDHEKLSSIMDEYIEHQRFLCSLNFRNGESLNPNNLKRYGVFCLFHIGEHIGLSKEGSPSPLYQFINIATDYDYKMISEHYAAYKKIDVIQEAESSIALRFIYDPNKHLAQISIAGQ